MKSIKVVTTSRTEEEIIEINEQDLRTMLENFVGCSLESARFFVKVPGGGDWSNTDLEIGEDSPLFIETVITNEEIERRATVQELEAV